MRVKKKKRGGKKNVIKWEFEFEEVEHDPKKVILDRRSSFVRFTTLLGRGYHKILDKTILVIKFLKDSWNED